MSAVIPPVCLQAALQCWSPSMQHSTTEDQMADDWRCCSCGRKLAELREAEPARAVAQAVLDALERPESLGGDSVGMPAGLERMLVEIGDRPLVIRSSSLLEDRIGHAFSGKYKSLFIANRGTIERRLAELEDAIAEVYASLFHPDPIEYRRERGLLEFNEEMGILIQEVVGKKLGRTLGFPTANVDLRRKQSAVMGIFAVRVNGLDGAARDAVASVGTRPTFDGTKPLLEVHIFDFDENIFLQVMQFNLQDDQVRIASKADTIADLRYEVTKQRFLIGKIDVLDLNVALEEKDVARRGYVEALRNYWNYYYDLRGLTLFDWQKGVRLSEDFDDLLD